MNKKKDKPGLLTTIILSLLAGIFVGIFDLWAFEPSIKAFSGGIAAGISFIMLFSIVNYFLPDGHILFQKLIWCFSGGIAGLVWWAVIRPVSINPLFAFVIGLIISFIWLIAENKSIKEKPSAF